MSNMKHCNLKHDTIVIMYIIKPVSKKECTWNLFEHNHFKHGNYY